MFNKLRNPKGVMLIIVTGAVFFLTIVSVIMFLLLRFRSKRAERWFDVTKAYYLCEAAISMAMFDLKLGYIGTDPNQWWDRRFTYKIQGRAGQDYEICYKVQKLGGIYTIEGITRSPGSLESKIDGITVPDQDIKDTLPVLPGNETWDNVYILKAGGRRAFPFFIFGKP